ncbi:MAG: glycosyltransferase [Planctomycetota bacterium]
MTILHIVLNNFTTDARVLRSASLGCELGADVVVFALGEDDLPEREERDGIQIRRFALKSRSWSKLPAVQLAKYAEALFRMQRAGRELEPEIVHAHDLTGLPIGYAISRSLNQRKPKSTRLLYDAHELWCDPEGAKMSHYVPGLFRLEVAIEGLLARRSDAVVTVSDGLADEMEKTLCISRPALLRNFPERPNAQVRSQEPGPLRDDLGISDDAPILLYQGHVRSGRGIETLIDAAPQLSNADARVVIVGSGPSVPELKERAAGSKTPERILFRPEVPLADLPRYTADATIGICPTEAPNKSYLYSLPNKLAEYVQAGLPVIASDLPETTKLCERLDFGVVFRVGDSQSLAARIDELLASKARLARHRNASESAAHELSWNSEKLVLRQIYEEILEMQVEEQPLAMGVAG